MAVHTPQLEAHRAAAAAFSLADLKVRRYD
jgi:hypothetical protein